MFWVRDSRMILPALFQPLGMTPLQAAEPVLNTGSLEPDGNRVRAESNKDPLASVLYSREPIRILVEVGPADICVVPTVKIRHFRRFRLPRTLPIARERVREGLLLCCNYLCCPAVRCENGLRPVRGHTQHGVTAKGQVEEER